LPPQANAPPFLSGQTSPNQEKEGGKHALAPALSSTPFCEAGAIKPIARLIDCSSQISDGRFLQTTHRPYLSDVKAVRNSWTNKSGSSKAAK
jgi:hypothetical protein